MQAYAAKHESPSIITDELASVSGAALVDVGAGSVEGFKVHIACTKCSTAAAAAVHHAQQCSENHFVLA